MKFEIKRFWLTWRTLYVIIIIVVMAAAAKAGGVQNQRVNELSGIQAAEAEYEAIQENPVITQTVIDRAWATYKGAASEGTDGRVLASEYAYPSVLLKYARYVYDKLPDQITDVSQFFEKRTQKILTDAAQSGQYSESELQQLEELAQATSGPFKNGEGSIWKTYFLESTLGGILFAAIAILTGAGFFWEDHKVGMDRVLASVGTRKLQRYAFRRIMAGILFLTVSYTVNLFVMTALLWRKVKYMYLDSPVIIAEYGSVYTDSIRSFYVKAALGGLISILVAYLISCLVNLCAKDRIRTLTVTAIIYFAPAVGVALKHIPAGLSRVAAVQPVMGIMYNKSLLSYHFYGTMTSYEMTSVIGVILILAICILILQLEKGNTGRIRWKADEGNYEYR